MKLFIVHPGAITSRNDWDRHTVGAGQLMRLYGVTPGECIVVHPGEMRGISEERSQAMHHLYPMSGPDYRLVTEAEREAIRANLAALDDQSRKER